MPLRGSGTLGVLGGAEEAGEGAAVVFAAGGGVRAQAPAVDGLQADPPQALGGLAVPAGAGPDVQVVAGSGFGLLDVVLAEQARGRLQRAHQGIPLDELAEVPLLG